MIFTRMQKYHKIGLIFVTVIIAAAFGMGTAIMDILDPTKTTEVAKMDKTKILQFDYINAQRRWRLFYGFANTVATLPESTIQVPEGIIVWRKFLSLLPHQQKEKRGRDILNQKDILVLLMLLKLAEDYNVQVTPKEFEEFYENTCQILGGRGDILADALIRYQLSEQEFTRSSQEMLLMLKFIDLQTLSAKVGPRSAFETFREKNLQFQFRYVDFPFEKYMKDTEKFSELRNEFLLKNPKYGVIPAKTDIRYVYILNSELEKDVRVTEEEVKAEFQKNFKEDEIWSAEDLEILGEELKVREQERFEQEYIKNKANIASRLKKERVAKLCEKKIEGVYNRLRDFKGIPNLEMVSEYYRVNYGYLDKASEEDIKKDDLLGTDQITKLIFQQLSPGKISEVLKIKGGEGYALILISNRYPAKTLQLSEISEKMFWERYFQDNIKEFKLPERFEFEAIIVDADQIRQDTAVNTEEMGLFYEKYKNTLFWDEEKKEPLPFQNVRQKIESQLKKSDFSQEIQLRIQAVSEKLKALGEKKAKDVNLEEIARHPDIRLIHFKTKKPLSKEDIENLDTIPDPELYQTIAALKEGQVSDIKESKQGRYIIRLTRRLPASDSNLEDVKDKVREHFMETYALSKASNDAREFLDRVNKRDDEQIKKVRENYTKIRQSLQIKIDDSKSIEEKDKLQKESEELKVREVEREKSVQLDTFLVEAKASGISIKLSPLTKDFSELHDLKEANLEAIRNLKEGEVSEVLAQPKLKTVLVAQMTKLQYPIPEETKLFQLLEIQWEQWGHLYQSRWKQWSEYEYLSKLTKLKLSESLKEEEDDENVTPP